MKIKIIEKDFKEMNFFERIFISLIIYPLLACLALIFISILIIPVLLSIWCALLFKAFFPKTFDSESLDETETKGGEYF
ncbi:MAG: hypothetical protein ACFFG0_10420 [Candidatus Thorarchaeota archaeon]